MKKILLLLGFMSLIMNAQVPNYVPTNGLVAYYPFNGNANDVSVNAVNGTLSGATLSTDRFGNSNSAFSFYGTNDYIEVPTTSGIFNNQEYTISFWVKTNQPASSSNGGTNVNPAIISRLIAGGPSNVSPSIGSATDLKVIYEINGAANSNTSIAGVLSTHNGGTGANKILGNVWHHIVYTYSLNNFSELVYCDGINISQILSTAGIQPINYNPYPFRFGRSLHTYWKDFSGELDDIGFWNRALTPAEITTMYNGVNFSDTCTAVSGSLVNGLQAYYPFCGNANDQSGNGNNGTVNGATLTTDRFGNSNSAYYLNSTSNISTNYSGILGGSSRSVNYWMKTTNASYIVPVAWGSILTQGGRFSCSFNYNNQGVSIDVANSAKTFSPIHPVNDNNWHMYTWVFDNSTGNTINFVKIYQDGILLSTLNTSFNPNTIINTLVENNLRFNGYEVFTDDVGIWSRALTTQEVTLLFNQNQCFTNTTVTDTLVINVGQLSYTNPIAYANNITIAPNPASTQININFSNITNLNGGSLKVINSLGQQVATTPITTSGTQSIMQLSTWGGSGMYYVQIINPQGIVVDVKKIILQ